MCLDGSLVTPGLLHPPKPLNPTSFPFPPTRSDLSLSLFTVSHGRLGHDGHPPVHGSRNEPHHGARNHGKTQIPKIFYFSLSPEPFLGFSLAGANLTPISLPPAMATPSLAWASSLGSLGYARVLPSKIILTRLCKGISLSVIIF
ncbi:hypothetical protein F8388_006401 [Cannabis sativa]|uniref:Uncharacterized protein n=1 Tax=Cannabis sativa TaxID=3483 RepID=A0A7J6F8P6_CANSA|nr:hypothetical protein F8388_006401 [Cannabis sativa]